MTYKFQTVFCLLLVGCGPTVKSRLSIIGGQPTKPGEFSEVVAILHDDRPLCTGTIVGPKHVLTAAHCVERFSQTSDLNLSVFIGEDANVSDPRQTVSIAQVSLHPGFWQDHLSSNDLAIMTTAIEMPIEPASLSFLQGSDTQVADIQDVTIVGYGITDRNSDAGTSGIKNWATAEIDRLSFSSNDLYVGNETSDACIGDSGGPVFIGDKKNSLQTLSAVTSRGPLPCAQEYEPGIATLLYGSSCWMVDRVDPKNQNWQAACNELKRGALIPLDPDTMIARSLNLASHNIRDISTLADLSKLESLDLSGNQIEDARVLIHLSQLKFVDLRNNRIQDSTIFSELKNNGVKVLGEHSQAENLAKTEFLRLSLLGSAAGIENRATILALRGMLANGDAERKSRDLAMRRVLGLAQKGIRSLAPLAHLENLERLLLGGNPLSSDLSPLLTLPRLQYLDLRDTKDFTDPTQKKLLETLQARGVRVVMDGAL